MGVVEGSYEIQLALSHLVSVVALLLTITALALANKIGSTAIENMLMLIIGALVGGGSLAAGSKLGNGANSDRDNNRN